MAETVDLTKTTITSLPTKIDVQAAPTIYRDKPTALAIALGITVDSVMNVTGHDGSEIICDQTKDDSKYRGYTVQDMVDICLMAGLSVTEIDLASGDDAPADYEREPTPGHKRVIVEWERFEQYLRNTRGIAVYHKLHTNDCLEHVFAYIGDGSSVTLVDPVDEIKFVYIGLNDLVERGFQFTSLLSIEKV
jgi:hypothetical protein